MSKLAQYLPVLRHVGIALGGGLAVFLIEIQATVVLSAYASALVSGGLAVLAGLGIGLAKRAAP